MNRATLQVRFPKPDTGEQRGKDSPHRRAAQPCSKRGITYFIQIQQRDRR